MSESWPELEALIDEMEPEDATLALLKYMFRMLAGIDGTLATLTPVIGAMAGRLGINADDIRRLTSGVQLTPP